jgi:hypothetical protein
LADVPSDVRWPPGDDVDFDDIFARLIALKEQRYPEHTARDQADPLIQVLTLVASLAQHAFGRANGALLQLSPKTMTSRAAAVSLMEVVARPLRPMRPARGPYYARLKSLTHIAGDVLTALGQRVAQTRSTDPVYTADEEVVWPTTATVRVVHHDASVVTDTTLTLPATRSIGTGDWLVLSVDTLAFDSLEFDVTPFGDACTLSLEHLNEEYGPVDLVTNLGATLRFTLDSYLFLDETLTDPTGLEVTVRYKSTGVSDDGVVAVVSGSLIVDVGFLGQVAPSTSPSDYEVFAEWRPVRGSADDTVGFSQDGSVVMDFGKLFDEDVEWVEDDAGRYSVRLRFISVAPNADPSNLTIAAVTLDRNMYVVSAVTQGVRTESNLGATDGSAFQFMPVPNDPIEEPVTVPAVSLTVSGDAEWEVVDDFSNSGSSSKHAMFKEDPDDGWGVLFGDGSVGVLPADGSTVRVTYRTNSTAPGDIDATSDLRAVGGSGMLDTWTFYRGTDGYQVPEVSDRASAIRFRSEVLPQLALRADSAITRGEIVTAMSGGAPNRATFETADGRRPFSRAAFSLEGAAARQYKVVVVGSESDPDGAVASADLTEAEEWLNGVEIGVEVIGGHGPNNTEAVVIGFTARPLRPTVTVTIANQNGVVDLVDQIVRAFFRPHSRDVDENFRWSFGGMVPLPILFGELWAAVPGRTFITFTVLDGVTTLQPGDSVDLFETELPTLDPAYDPTVDIVLVSP